MSIKEIITKTLFLILILHIFHEEEWDQASAELPNFSLFIFYLWKKWYLFKKKWSFYTLTIIHHNPATSFPGQRGHVLDYHGVSVTQVSVEYLIIPWIDPLTSVAPTLVKHPPLISFVYLQSWALSLKKITLHLPYLVFTLYFTTSMCVLCSTAFSVIIWWICFLV